MPRSESELAQRAEFYLCLARAFLPPVSERAYRGFTHYVADDLAELGAALGYPIAKSLDALRTAVAAVPDTQTLREAYSKLFLVPPTPAHLSAGWYMDGTYRGAYMTRIEATYRRYGLARSPDFHDAPDHLVAELEFVAFMFGSAVCGGNEAADFTDEAGDFLHRYVQPWLPILRADIASAVGKFSLPPVYLYLAFITEAAVGCDAAPVAAVPVGVETQYTCRRCGGGFAVKEDLHVMRTAMRRQGAEVSLLDLCPNCRAGDLNLSTSPFSKAGRRYD